MELRPIIAVPVSDMVAVRGARVIGFMPTDAVHRLEPERISTDT